MVPIVFALLAAGGMLANQRRNVLLGSFFVSIGATRGYKEGEGPLSPRFEDDPVLISASSLSPTGKYLAEVCSRVGVMEKWLGGALDLTLSEGTMLIGLLSIHKRTAEEVGEDMAYSKEYVGPIVQFLDEFSSRRIKWPKRNIKKKTTTLSS